MAEKWYKRFLVLNLKYESVTIVPNKVLDTIWHYHILDTMKYAEDCQSIFGSFLHHFPYFGLRGEEDASNLKEAFVVSSDLFMREFGESLGELNKAFKSDTHTSAACMGTECGGTACGGTNKIGSSADFSTRPVFLH